MIKYSFIRKSALGCLSFVLAALSWAVSNNYSDLEEFPFLKLTPYARPSGLAGAYTALAEGLDAIYSNPAGLANQPRRDVSAGLKTGFLNTRSGDISVSHKVQGYWVATHLNHINHGTIDVRDERNSPTGQEIMPYQSTFSIFAAKEYFSSLRVGMGFKLPTEYLGDIEGFQWALGWGVDLGIQYQPNIRQLTFGLAATNWGKKTRGHFKSNNNFGLLPLEIRGGFVYRSIRNNGVLASVDLVGPYHQPTYAALGVEYPLFKSFVLRGGVRFNLEEIDLAYRDIYKSESVDYFSDTNAKKGAFGFTLKRMQFDLDYAAEYWHLLGIFHQVTFKWHL